MPKPIRLPLALLALLLCALLAGPSAGLAAPVSLPTTVPSGGASWAVSNAGGTDTGVPYTGVCSSGPGLAIQDASIQSPPAGDAYDVGYALYVGGTIFNPGPTVDLTGATLTAGPVTLSGLDVTYEAYFSAVATAARIRAIFTNPTAASISATIDVPVNFGSDSGTIVRATSSGDTAFTAADRWLVTSDGGPSDPVNTTVFYGPGTPRVVPSSVTSTVFDCAAPNGAGATFQIDVPSGATRSLVFFAGLGDITPGGNTVAGAIAAAAQFDANATINPDLLSGLTADDLAEVLNWSFGYEVAHEGFDNPTHVTNLLTAAGHQATALSAAQIEAGALLSGGYDVVVVSRNTTFSGASAAYVAAIGDFVAAGGNVVAEWSGAGLFFSSYAADIRSPADQTPQLGIFSGAVHAGDAMGTSPMALVEPGHPVLDGIANPYVDGGGTEFFFWIETSDPALETLATITGNGGPGFPAGELLPTILVGCKNGSAFVFGTHDWNDTLSVPGSPAVTFLRNAVGFAGGGCESVATCGNDVVEAGEACDDGNTADGDCCSSACEHEPSGSACDTDTDLCTVEECDGSGSCGAVGNVSCQPASPPCEGGETCNPATGSCEAQPDAAAGTACTDDGDACTDDECDGAGTCQHPALPDTDGDLLCDQQDECTNVGGARDFYATKPKPRLVVSKVNADTTPGNDALRLSAAFDLPSASSFAALNPLTRGARIVVLNQAGGVEVDQVLPGGAYGGTGTRGWKTNAKGTLWQFQDRTGSPLSGITGFKVTDRSKTSPGQVRASLTAKKGSYPVVAGDQPLEMIVVLGDQTDAMAGYCGESDFTAANCTFNGAQTTLTCKK